MSPRAVSQGNAGYFAPDNASDTTVGRYAVMTGGIATRGRVGVLLKRTIWDLQFHKSPGTDTVLQRIGFRK